MEACSAHPVLILLIIAAALLFDFINGFHDAANSIATVVSTRVLSPGLAVIWAAFFNFVAVFLFGTHVARTIGKGMVDPTGITVYVVLAGLLGAILWDLLTWWWGLPTSSSHALIGGFGGAAVVHAGWDVLILPGFQKTILFIFVAPILGMVLAYLYMVVVMQLFRRASPTSVDHLFRKGQLLSAALYSLSHGSNDAQKTMGIITLALFIGHQIPDLTMPLWVRLVCALAMAMGTAIGGWKIIKTMGHKIFKLEAVHGFSAETSAAGVISLASSFGAPISTTHVISAAILGVGSSKRLSAVRWGIAGQMATAWLMTIPAAAAVAAVCFEFLRFVGLVD